jgi:hypothetical protein
MFFPFTGKIKSLRKAEGKFADNTLTLLMLMSSETVSGNVNDSS